MVLSYIGKDQHLINTCLKRAAENCKLHMKFDNFLRKRNFFWVKPAKKYVFFFIFKKKRKYFFNKPALRSYYSVVSSKNREFGTFHPGRLAAWGISRSISFYDSNRYSYGLRCIYIIYSICIHTYIYIYDSYNKKCT